ncbi:MAG: hypothetical protein MH204_02730, partial [Fimbriimonadaceae bacterium]|nr:hypothetical protein [Fimbriimonadaceae bacterium]
EDKVDRGPYGRLMMIHGGLRGPVGGRDFSSVPKDVIAWSVPPTDPRSEVVARLQGAASAPIGSSPEGFGEFRLENGRLASLGVIARGGVRLSRPAGASAVRMRITTTSTEPLALNISSPDGRLVASVLVAGELENPPESMLDARTADSSIAVDLAGVPGWSADSIVDLGAPRVGGPYERLQIDKGVWTLADIAWGGEAPAPRAAEPGSRELALRSWRASIVDRLAAGEWDDLGPRFTSRWSRERFSAIALFLSVKDDRAVPLLLAAAKSAEPADAFLAARALGHQGTEAARTALLEVLRRGPFEFNRRFAAESFPGEVTAEVTQAAGLLMVQRGWRVRLAGVRLLSRSREVQAQYLLSAALGAGLEPHPAVRVALAEGMDPNMEIAARRLLFNAVNDPMESARIAAHQRLVETGLASIRREAAESAVNDESPAVRLALLAAYRDRPNPDQRAALRRAVVDLRPDVRAAALRALAAQPDPILAEEVSNTFADPDPIVQIALAEAAAARRITLPAEVVRRLKTSSDAQVRQAAVNIPYSLGVIQRSRGSILQSPRGFVRPDGRRF